MIETLPVVEKAEIIDMGHLNSPEKTTPVEKRTDAERYDNLLIKTEAKAREFTLRLDLNPTETKRLAEIQADINYFKTKRDEAASATRTPTAVREELIALAKKPEAAAEIEAKVIEKIGPPPRFTKVNSINEGLSL